VQLVELPLSSLQSTFFAPVATNEIVAVVLVVGLSGLLVIVTLSADGFGRDAVAWA
jgi:hypothetical protein